VGQKERGVGMSDNDFEIQLKNVRCREGKNAVEGDIDLRAVEVC
jgi:hypothetical protein